MEGLAEGCVALFVVMDPLGNIPFYLHLVQGMDARERRSTLCTASAFALFLLLLFLFGSRGIFHYLDIQLEHIMVVGGILLVILGFEMMFGSEEHKGVGRDIAVVPLGMPLMAGGGSIATILILSARYGLATPLVCIGVVMVVQYAIYLLAPGILSLLGRNGLRVLGNVAALVAASFGIQILSRGVAGLV